MKQILLGSLIILFSGYSAAQVIGVAPKDQHLYVPTEGNKWACLNNPEIVLDFSQVNDDYCDCPDGSDEPGTSACPNNWFYCENNGHVGGYIKSSLVNDGKCDYENCCDGSDEWNTGIQCENRCKEIHEEYVKAEKSKQAIYIVGKDKAEKTISAAKRLRDKLETALNNEKAVLGFVSSELLKHQEQRDELNKLQQSHHFQHDIENLLKSLKKTISDNYNILIQNKKNLDALNQIAENLVQTFNENLNDPAVALTVDRYKKHYEDFKSSYEGEKKLNIESTKTNALELIEMKDFEKTKDNFKTIIVLFDDSLNKNKGITERVIEIEVIFNYLIENYNPNFNDPNVKEAVQQYQDYISNKPSDSVSSNVLDEIKGETSRLEPLITQNYKIEQHPIESIIPVKDNRPLGTRLKHAFSSLLDDFLGLTPELPKERSLPTQDENLEFFNELTENKKISEDKVAELEANLSRDLGPSDILRALEEISFSKRIGEYDYQVSFLGEIHQKGANNHNVKIGSYNHYELETLDDRHLRWKLHFTDGAKCWNGPKRSAVVVVECGDHNDLISVGEPEKCEYLFKVKAPLGCRVE